MYYLLIKLYDTKFVVNKLYLSYGKNYVLYNHLEYLRIIKIYLDFQPYICNFYVLIYIYVCKFKFIK